MLCATPATPYHIAYTVLLPSPICVSMCLYSSLSSWQRLLGDVGITRFASACLCACIVRDTSHWVRGRGYWEMSESLGSRLHVYVPVEFVIFLWLIEFVTHFVEFVTEEFVTEDTGRCRNDSVPIYVSMYLYSLRHLDGSWSSWLISWSSWQRIC